MSIFDKAKGALNSDKAEEISDKGLDSAEKFATDKFGAEHADKISKGRDAIDERIGNEGATRTNVDGTEKNI